MINPFSINSYDGPEYFCDRTVETEDITSLLINRNNIALSSPRRIGKTALIRHCFELDIIKENYYTFIIDIYNTHNLKDFVGKLSRAILLKLAPFRSSDSYTRTYEFAIPTWTGKTDMGEILDPEFSLGVIFQHLNKADKRCLIAIDEFQQISKYDNNVSVEALLRTYIQMCPNANFIFVNSNRSMMAEMFTSNARPFYEPATLYNLGPIPLDKYAEFCQYHFINAHKKIDTEVIESLYNKFKGITAYMISKSIKSIQ